MLQDIRFAVRMLVKSPGFTVVAVVTLALGIGLNATIFSVVNAFLFRPPNLPEPERLVVIKDISGKWGSQFNPTAAVYDEWKRQSRLLDGIARGEFNGSSGTLSGIGRAERVKITYATPDFFSMLKQKPLRGRTFLPEDARSGQGTTAVISYDLWQRVFGTDPRVIGQTVAIDGNKRIIVGVLPARFSAAPDYLSADAWLVYNPAGDPSNRELTVIGRMKPGVTVQQAEAELSAIARRSRGDATADTRINVQTIQERAARKMRGSLYFLLGSVGFVLLIACANIANLLVARAGARRLEIAIRASMGASRLRILRQLLTESILLAMIGGAGGILLAVWGNEAFVALAPADMAGVLESIGIGIDLRVLAFMLGISVFTGIVFGLAPSLQASKLNLSGSLKEGGGRSGGGSRQFGRSALVVSEVAMALMLLVSAGLMINSFAHLRRADLGFNPTNVLRADVFLNGPKYWQQLKGDKKRVTPQGAVFFQQVLARTQALPGVISAAVAHQAPPGDVWPSGFEIIGRPPDLSKGPPLTRYFEVSDGFFRTLRIPLRSGRYLTERDNESSPWTIVINETLARTYFPNENPIGRHVHLVMLGGGSIFAKDDRPREIIGVVGDTRYFGFNPNVSEKAPVMYGSYLQHAWEYPGGTYSSHLWKSVLIRTSSDPMKLAGPLEKIVAEVDKDQALFDIGTVEKKLAVDLGQYGFVIQIFGFLGGVALLLAAVGIYGVVSYSVTQRTHEIGVRMAHGARKGDVLRLVIRQGLKLTLLGIVIGLTGSIVLARLISRILYGVTASDPLTYATVSLILTLVALAACAVPARRATKVDPIVALRYE